MTRLEVKSIPEDGEKTRLLTMEHLDGRTVAVRQVRTFERALANDLGGDLPAAKAALAKRSAVLVAILSNAEAEWALGQPLALTDYLATANCLRRLLTSLGLERSPKAIPGSPPDIIGDGP